MAEYRLTARARQDLENIWLYVQEDSGEAMADHVERALFKKFEEIVALRGIGYRRADVRWKRYRFVNVFEYVNAFTRGDTVIIRRVIHGARDIPRRL